MTTFEGHFNGENMKVGIVLARFNEFITSKLLSGAIDNLTRHGVKEENIDIYWVPGAFEIPYITKKIVEKNQYDGVLTLGAVIRGATTHYELVSNEVAKGIAHIGLEANVPVMFGVLTTETIEQAIERSGTKAGNKGSEVAQGLIEMISLTNTIS
ncbi:6,7-dimethyl-8-ribityllumazine synthase [Listeria booriae]|uniref:6,7-dimethyl-8-ribityllumazine synthase n=1 Tax=Listeria booriae TaxID=1552123 RepID=UPI0016256987|nr:6,7-dimethyl-8-ribityllumazine synthase [Listeria booriae]MBC1914228.1 6,7-dimethyl-8-ribityllumazine synthase [Listeria booriae]